MYRACFATTTDGAFANAARTGMPWEPNLDDLKHFKEYTKGSTLIMGKTTYQHLPRLAERPMLVVTHSRDFVPTEMNAEAKAITQINDFYRNSDLYQGIVVGGPRILQWFLDRNMIYEFAHTVLHPDQIKSDVAEEKMKLEFEGCGWIAAESWNIHRGHITIWRRINVEEMAVIDAIRKLCAKPSTPGRSINTRRSFGHTFKFCLKHGRMPVMTTRKLAWQLAAREMLFYLSGQTNTKLLEAQGFRGWSKQTTSAFLQKRGLGHLPEGDMGAAYGFQLRHFGARYVDCHTDYTGQGLDQLTRLVHSLRTEPHGRRHMVTMFNPADEHLMAIPACLHSYQFWVENNELSCMATQRSSDSCTAAGWNIFQIALFVRMLCAVTGYAPGEMQWHVGDFHIYDNHVDIFARQERNLPGVFPLFEIDIDTDDISKIGIEHMRMYHYRLHERIDYPFNE